MLCSNAKNPDGAGQAYIEAFGDAVSGCFCTAQHCVRMARKPACRPSARRGQPPVRLAHQPAGVGPKLERSMPGCRARGAARHRHSAASASGAIDRQRAAQAERGAGRPMVTVAVTVEEPSPRPPHRAQRPYASSPATTRHHADPDLFSTRARITWRSSCRWARCATSPAPPILRRHAADGDPDRVVDEKGFAICRWSSDLSAHRGARAGNVRRAMDGALARLPELPEWQTKPGSRPKRFPRPSPDALLSCIGQLAAHDISVQPELSRSIDPSLVSHLCSQ